MYVLRRERRGFVFSTEQNAPKMVYSKMDTEEEMIYLVKRDTDLPSPRHPESILRITTRFKMIYSSPLLPPEPDFKADDFMWLNDGEAKEVELNNEIALIALPSIDTYL